MNGAQLILLPSLARREGAWDIIRSEASMNFRTLIAAGAGASLLTPAVAFGAVPGDDRDATIAALERQVAVLQAAVTGPQAIPDAAAKQADSSQSRRTAAIDESRVIDLTHPFNAASVYWPTARKFELTQVAHGHGADGRWYASNDFCASEHGGTHIDAPVHFAEGRRDTAGIPLGQLMGPARVIDIGDRCSADRDYRLAPEDVLAHEARHGPIEPGSVVLIRTGFGRYYPDAKKYIGSDVRGEAMDLHFPGIGEAAAKLLVERRIDLVGLDTASLDHGPSRDFIAHRVLNGADIPGLENVANLERLPPAGAWVIALPMKIEGGTGGPCRIIAILP
jgi:kynurenine formamidase